MEVLIFIVVLVVVAAATTVTVARRSRGRVELEPPPAAPPLTPKASTTAPTTPAAAATATPTPTPVPDDLVEQVEEALSTVTDEPPTPPVPEPEPVVEVKPKFRDRLGKARTLFSGYVGNVLSRSTIDEETWNDLEEALVRADVGIGTTTSLLDDLRGRVKAEAISTPEELMQALRDDLKKSLAAADRGLRFEPGLPNVWLFVGVNGVGKTTTIGKIGLQQVQAGRPVMMAAGDTFRAAAARATRAVGRARRRRHRAWCRGRRSRRHRVRCRTARRGHRTSSSCWPTPPAASTTRST